MKVKIEKLNDDVRMLIANAVLEYGSCHPEVDRSVTEGPSSRLAHSEIVVWNELVEKVNK